MSTHPVLAIHPGVAAVAQDTAGCVLLHHRRVGQTEHRALPRHVARRRLRPDQNGAHAPVEPGPRRVRHGRHRRDAAPGRLRPHVFDERAAEPRALRVGDEQEAELRLRARGQAVEAAGVVAAGRGSARLGDEHVVARDLCSGVTA